MRAARVGLVLGLVLASLAMPADIAACTCGSQRQGQVVFLGTAVDQVEHGGVSVWTFELDEVIRGDPGDGRVVTARSGSAACGWEFHVGGRYEVHAEIVDPTQPYRREVTGIPLATHTCLAGDTAGLDILRSPIGLLLVVSPIGLVVAVGLVATCLSLRRRWQQPRPVSTSRESDHPD